MELTFCQVDVFAAEPFRGNPLAVAVGADGLSDAQIANWTNLSETTFLLRQTHPDADYRVRIFTQLTSFCRTSDTWKRIRVGRSIGGVSRCVSILSQRIALRFFAAKS